MSTIMEAPPSPDMANRQPGLDPVVPGLLDLEVHAIQAELSGDSPEVRVAENGLHRVAGDRPESLPGFGDGTPNMPKTAEPITANEKGGKEGGHEGEQQPNGKKQGRGTPPPGRSPKSTRGGNGSKPLRGDKKWGKGKDN